MHFLGVTHKDLSTFSHSNNTHTHTHPHTVCRLDKSFFIQGFEWFDPGYRTYISCLLLDAYYSNPVLVTFVR